MNFIAKSYHDKYVKENWIKRNKKLFNSTIIGICEFIGFLISQYETIKVILDDFNIIHNALEEDTNN